MGRFKKWLTPAIVTLAALAIILGGLSGFAPASLGQIFDPTGNPFAHRFSDVKDIRTATYVVAASNSQHRYEADFYCNGTADEVQINAALIAAAGGKVTLLDGLFTTAASIDMPEYTILEGQGINATRIVGADNITVISATAVGTSYGGGVRDMEILVNEAAGVGLYVNNLWKFFAHNLVIRDNGTNYLYGIHTANAAYETDINNCRIIEAARGVFADSNGVVVTNSDLSDTIGIYVTKQGVKITTNWLENCTTCIEITTGGNYSSAHDNIMSTATTGVLISGTADNCSVYANVYTGVTTPVYLTSNIGSFDLLPVSVEMDLSAAAEDFPVFTATVRSQIVGYTVQWTEAAGDANTCDIRVGEVTSGSVVDNDEFDSYTTAGNEALGRNDILHTGDLTDTAIAEGTLITVGHTQKVGNGKVIITLWIVKVQQVS